MVVVEDLGQRVRQVFKRLLTVTMTVTITAFLIVSLFPGQLAQIFNDDQELVALVDRVMPVFFAGIWAFGAQMACQTTFMALGQAKTSLFLALLRKVILLVPLAILLPRITKDVYKRQAKSRSSLMSFPSVWLPTHWW